MSGTGHNGIEVRTEGVRSCPARAMVPLLAVLAICAASRIWLVANSKVIARDGTLYVDMARRWPHDPKGVVDDYDFHVGYPVAIVGVHRLMSVAGLGGAPDDPLSWDRAGQVVSLVSSLAGIAGIWLFAGLAFNWWIAWVTALLFGIGRKWSALGADVLSDALAICLLVWCVVLAALAARQLERKRWSTVLLAAGAGVGAGAGYLVRPEALMGVILVTALLLANQLRRRASWRIALASIAAAAVSATACALPYMIAIGGLTKKKDIFDILRGLFCRVASVFGFATVQAGNYGPTREVLNELFEALHPALGVLVCIWLLTWAVSRLPRTRLPDQVRLAPSWVCGFLMLAAAAVLAPLLIGLRASAGYVSERHVMFMAALLAPLAGAGWAIFIEWIIQGLTRLRVPRGRARFAWPVATAILAIALLLHCLRPLHEDKAYYRRAGEFLATLPPGGCILIDSAWTGHYAKAARPGVDVRSISGQSLAEARLIRKVRTTPAAYLAVSDRTATENGLDPKALLRLPGLQQIRQFRQIKDRWPDTLRVFRIDRAALRDRGRR